MKKRVSTLIYLEEEEYERLRRLSFELRKSQSSILREAFRLWKEKGESTEDSPLPN